MAKQSGRKNKPKTLAVGKQVATITDAFVEEVEQALKRFHDPGWLGKFSVLATPYLLGATLLAGLPVDRDEATTRGKVVQQLLRDATEILVLQNEKWGNEWQALLQLRFLNQNPASVWEVMMKLSITESSFLRYKDAAIEQLAQVIIQRLKPALRLELPVVPATLFGRDALIEQGLTVLRQGKTVGVSGAGGMGKTALGARLAHRFAPSATFWFTLRPGLNDQLNSLLFSLAYFLHGQGASGLWSQLVAERGVSKQQVALNLLHHDLARLTDSPVLLCFDEIDLLRPSEVETHAPFIPFLESLRGLVPMLLIGQKSTLETDAMFALTGLSAPFVAQLLQQAQLLLPPAELQKIQTYTEGNPRLLELVIALLRSSQRQTSEVVDIWSNGAQATSLEFFLRRIWQHLDETEMYLLEILPVFRNPVPRMAWSTGPEQAAIDQLIEWHLIQTDGRGGIDLLPAFKAVINETLLSGDEKKTLHCEAARIRARYGQYTAAAYHWLAGGEPQIALWQWHGHHKQEIDQGQAAAALSLWQSISPQDLQPEEQEILIYLRADLLKLLGRYDQSLQELRATYWHVPFLKAHAKRLEGDIAELRGEASQARQAYQAGLATIEHLLVETADFHRDLGYLYSHERDFDQAERQVLRIRHEAANLEGLIRERQGDVTAAQTAYLAAIHFAQAAQYPYGEANTRSNLGAILGWHRELAQAEHHLHEAIQFFKLTGRLNKLASATFNLAFARHLADQYAAAIAPAEEAFALFEQLGEEFGKAVAAQILAEVHLALHNLDQAESFAWRVIQTEHVNTQPDGLRTLGEIRLQQGNLSEAEQFIQQSLKLAQANQDKILAGYAWRALGEVQLALGNHAQAKENLAQAIALFDSSNLREEIEKTRRIGQANGLSFE